MTRRTALVTGANRGIGLETCLQLARRGFQVLLTARDAKAGQAEADRLARDGLSVEFAPLDVAHRASVTACAAQLAQRGIEVDVLVNNAGVYSEAGVLEEKDDAWLSTQTINLLGPVWCCRAFVPAMIQRGYGRVVNVSSGSGAFAEGLEGPAAYCVSKAGLNALTRKLAQDIPAGIDVKINALCPGWVRTRMGGPDAERDVSQGAATIVWLATLPTEGPSGGFFRDNEPIPW